MKIYRRLAIHYIIVICTICFMSIFAGMFFSPLLSAYTFYFFELDHEKHQGLYIFLFVIPPIVLFLLINLFYAKKMSEIFSFFYSWINTLSKGSYDVPKYPKKTKGTFSFFYLFQELNEKLHLLSADLKQSEEKRKELENLRKDWTSGVTHDLKTPLSYIQGYSKMLLEKKYEWTEEEKEKFITLIHEKALHMKELIDDLNTAFKFESGHIPLDKKPHNIVKLLEEIRKDINKQPNKLETQIILTPEDQVLCIFYDEHLLKRALINIVMNAVLHNPNGTLVEIKIFRLQSHYLTIEIIDNGKGLSEHELNLLFERYYRGSSTDFTEGSGLGMSIAQQLIKAHNGQITVTSALNEGTTIRVTLPLHSTQN